MFLAWQRRFRYIPKTCFVHRRSFDRCHRVEIYVTLIIFDTAAAMYSIICTFKLQSIKAIQSILHHTAQNTQNTYSVFLFGNTTRMRSYLCCNILQYPYYVLLYWYYVCIIIKRTSHPFLSSSSHRRTLRVANCLYAQYSRTGPSLRRVGRALAIFT